MVGQPVDDRDTRTEVFFSGEYEEDMEKVATAINRWLRGQEDEVKVCNINYQNCISGSKVGGPFLVAITHTKPK